MFLNIIFFATLYPVLFIICIVFALQNSYKDGMLFAVNMKREWVEDENVKAIQKRFKKEMIWYSLILAIIPFSCLFIPYFSIQMTIWMVWLIGAIIMLTLPTIFANNRLKQWKLKMGYYEAVSYTHLDVYKRQRTGCLVCHRCRGKCRSRKRYVLRSKESLLKAVGNSPAAYIRRSKYDGKF